MTSGDLNLEVNINSQSQKCGAAPTCFKVCRAACLFDLK